MFTCRACLRQTILSILYETPSSNLRTSRSLVPLQRVTSPATLLSLRRPGAVNPSSIKSNYRKHSTIHSLRQGHHRRVLLKGLSKERPPSQNKRRTRILLPAEERDLRARINNDKHLKTPDAEDALVKQAAYSVRFVAGDPLELAQAVLSKLKNGGNFAEALEMVRASEKVTALAAKGDKESSGTQVAPKKRPVMNNVVSWNHLMDWAMEQHDPVNALKVYNEMKKRGHRPDAQTYTIMLRGFSRNVRSPRAVEAAVKIYNSIFAPNSEVIPNTIHTNAVLHVCTRGDDIDALWGIAGRLPERGPGAPDNCTYTTILQAIRVDAHKSAARLIALDNDDAAVSRIFEKAIEDGRKLWRDVIARWQRGDIEMDERLVCAMGRLLMLADKTSNKQQPIDDMFRLVEQTMNLKLSDSNSESANNVRIGTSRNPGAIKFKPSASSPTQAQEVSLERVTQGPSVNLSQGGAKFYAVPENNTLAMLVEGATMTKQVHLGKAYWDLLTSNKHGFNVAPDAGNISAYLRLLRISRASKAALELLRQDWPEDVASTIYSRGSFVIVMSTCVRDKNNPNAFETAGRVLDLMQEKALLAQNRDQEQGDDDEIHAAGQTLDLDPKVMTMYLDLATAPADEASSKLIGINKQGKMDLESDQRWHNLLRALKRFSPDVVNISRLTKLKIAQAERETLNRGRRSESRKPGFVEVDQIAERLQDLAGLLTGLVSAYDRVLGVNFRLEEAGMKPLDKAFVDDCLLQKRKLSAMLHKVPQDLTTQINKSGLWKGYAESGEAATDEAANEGNEIEHDRALTKTPARAKLEKAAWKEKTLRETQESNRRLSRRQVQEKERARREDRQKNAPPQSRSRIEQHGWGGEYEAMAREAGQGGRAGLIEL